MSYSMWLVVCSVLPITTAASPYRETFRWKTATWPAQPYRPTLVVNSKGSVWLSCQTNDPDANVALYYRRKASSISFEKVLYRARGRIYQIGQNFFVTSVMAKDAGYYTCTAVNVYGQTLQLQKGFLSVNDGKSPKDKAREFITQKLKENKVVVFCKSWCPYCRRVKRILGSLWNYLLIDVDKLVLEEHILDTLRDMTGQRTVPRVFINGRFFGGYDVVLKMYSSGKLKTLIRGY